MAEGIVFAIEEIFNALGAEMEVTLNRILTAIRDHTKARGNMGIEILVIGILKVVGQEIQLVVIIRIVPDIIAGTNTNQRDHGTTTIIILGLIAHGTNSM